MVGALIVIAGAATSVIVELVLTALLFEIDAAMVTAVFTGRVAGAVYNPLLEIVPEPALTLQIAVPVAPVIVAVNCSVFPTATVEFDALI